MSDKETPIVDKNPNADNELSTASIRPRRTLLNRSSRLLHPPPSPKRREPLGRAPAIPEGLIDYAGLDSERRKLLLDMERHREELIKDATLLVRKVRNASKVRKRIQDDPIRALVLAFLAGYLIGRLRGR